MVTSNAAEIAAIRRFNRYYTRAIGALHEGLLGSNLTLTEGRVVFETATRQAPTATIVGQELGLDPGYMSRLVKSLEARGIVERAPHPTDARQSLLALTATGRALFDEINAASAREVGALVAGLSDGQRRELVASMATIETLLGGAQPTTPAVVLRPHKPGDIGQVISRHGAIYAAEYGWDITFEALVARVAADFIDNFDAHSDCCFIADRGGDVLGSAFVVRKDETTAKLRLVYVEASERGAGLGRQLVEACMRFARDAGYERMTLWTNNVLLPAKRLYQGTGFEMTASEPHRSFGVDLVSETWERDL